MSFQLKEPFNFYKKCSKCEFEICVGSASPEASIRDWAYCSKCGHKEKVFKKDRQLWEVKDDVL